MTLAISCNIRIFPSIRKKLDDKGEQMILVRYHPTGGYKLYDAVNKIIIINKDVIFNEERD